MGKSTAVADRRGRCGAEASGAVEVITIQEDQKASMDVQGKRFRKQAVAGTFAMKDMVDLPGSPCFRTSFPSQVTTSAHDLSHPRVAALRHTGVSPVGRPRNLPRTTLLPPPSLGASQTSARVACRRRRRISSATIWIGLAAS